VLFSKKILTTDERGGGFARAYYGSPLNDWRVPSTFISNFHVIPFPCLTALTDVLLHSTSYAATRKKKFNVKIEAS
jgi:hypothetical protein